MLTRCSVFGMVGTSLFGAGDGVGLSSDLATGCSNSGAPAPYPSTCLFAICLTLGDTDGDYPGLPVVLPSKQDE
jgi:hypothetical protein